MNEVFKSLVSRSPRVHFSIVWEADELDESGEFMEHYVAVHATTVVNGEMLIGHSDFLEGIPIANGEEPTDEDLILSGHIEELCKEALENLKTGMAEGMPIEPNVPKGRDTLGLVSRGLDFRQRGDCT